MGIDFSVGQSLAKDYKVPSDAVVKLTISYVWS